jgi:hypothetical protein
VNEVVIASPFFHALTLPKSRKDPQISLGPVGVTPDEYVGPRVHCRVRKVLQPEGGWRFRNNRHSHVLWDTFASMRSATFVGFVSIEFVSLLIALVSLTLLIRRVREARRAAEIVGDGGGVTREYAGPSPYTPSSSPGATYTSGGGRRETDRLWPAYGYPDLRTERKGPGDA